MNVFLAVCSDWLKILKTGVPVLPKVTWSRLELLFMFYYYKNQILRNDRSFLIVASY